MQMEIASTTCNSDQKWNNETCHCECKNYRTRKKDHSWNPSICICEMVLKKLLSMIHLINYLRYGYGINKCGKCYITNMSTNFHGKKVIHKIYCYILVQITIFNCYYLISLYKT